MKRLSILGLAIFLMISLSFAAMAWDSDSDTTQLEFTVINPWVEWIDVVNSTAFETDVEIDATNFGMQAWYLFTNSFEVQSSNTYQIEIEFEPVMTSQWQNVYMNPGNRAVAVAQHLQSAFDVRVSNRVQNLANPAVNEPWGPWQWAGYISDLPQAPTFPINASDTQPTAEYTVIHDVEIKFVLFDIAGETEGRAGRRRFHNLPAGYYETDVIVTITELPWSGNYQQ